MAGFPFVPNEDDLLRIGRDVSDIPLIQERFIAGAADRLKGRDRPAHQYQIAGGQVSLRVAASLPQAFAGIGLFDPGATHVGIGRISTGLGCPHHETDPDFLGLRLSFATASGRPVDILGINDPAAPTDNHVQFMKLLDATAEGAGHNLFGSTAVLTQSLTASLGLREGLAIATHVLRQTLRTSASRSACQTYWTGILALAGRAGKLSLRPHGDDHGLALPDGGARHLTEEWRARQNAGDIVFALDWLPFLSEAATPLAELTRPWQEQPVRIGDVTFPRCDAATPDAVAWAALAAEMGASPANWISEREDSPGKGSTEFAVARAIAYAASQDGRDALAFEDYAGVFVSGVIPAALRATLDARRGRKRAAGHIDMAS